MEYFAGIDVSLRSCALCIVDGKGNVLLERGRCVMVRSQISKQVTARAVKISTFLANKFVFCEIKFRANDLQIHSDSVRMLVQ
jgi:hypothetical protein